MGYKNVDAHILVDLLRGGYIAVSHVPDKKIIESRQIVRYRHDKVEQRTQCKNVIHGILLQDAIAIPGSTFSNAYTRALHGLNDYRIEGNLKIIDSINDVLYKINAQNTCGSRCQQGGAVTPDNSGCGGIHSISALLCHRQCGKISRFCIAGVILWIGTICQKLGRRDASREDNQKGRQDCTPHVLVEAAHTHVRYAPHSKLSQFYQRVKAKRGTSKATVATASKMLRIIYQMLKNGSEFQP